MKYYLVCSEVDGAEFIKKLKIIENFGEENIYPIGHSFILRVPNSDVFEQHMIKYKLNDGAIAFIYVQLFYDRSVPICNTNTQITNFDTNIAKLEYIISDNI